MIVYVVLLSVCALIYYLWKTLKSSSDFAEEDTSIDAFIDHDKPSTSSSKKSPQKDRYTWHYEDLGRQILILFGTEYGFSEELAKLLFDKVISTVKETDAEYPWQPRLVNAKNFTSVDFMKERLCFIIISTSGDGVPPSEARPFYNHLMTMTESLANLHYSVLALGDSNYPHYCKTGRTLNKRLCCLGASEVVKCQDIDQEDWPIINKWMGHVISMLNTIDVTPCMDYLRISLGEDDSGFSRHRPYLATVKVKHELTRVTLPGDKETIHVEFDVEDSLTWTAGDALGIYPENNPEHVSDILSHVSFSGETLIPTPPTAYKQHPENESVRESLRRYYDIKHVQPVLLEALSKTVTHPKEKAQLQHLLQNGVTKSNTHLHCYLELREVRDIVSDFDFKGFTAEDFVACLRPLHPRYYSISSSPSLDDTTVCITAAVVRYESLDIERSGVTTCHLQDQVQKGDVCPVFISQNDDFRLPSNTDVPLILIGPGTGIAPFRAFIEEREMSGGHGEIYLYFGCRYKEKDFLYREELERWEGSGRIHLRTAFSRDGENKRYVQHLLEEDSTLVWRVIDQDSGYIYVCGDARNMAKDVHNSLCSIVRTEGHLEEDQAQEYLRNLEQAKRYQKDVWVT